MAKKVNTADAVHEIALPVASEMGLTLWDVQFAKEGPSWFLRLIIDKDGGVDIDDCEKFSRAVDPLIDELDPTELEYYFEVSSPGLGRFLKTDEHLEAYIGRDVTVKLYKPDKNGIKEESGVLESFDADSITIANPKQKVHFIRSEVATVKADDDKDLFGGNKKK
ncbi:MAG: ribosome maturation factor RimP [Oscillospiraceae bacterium]